jgi:hypothetical protein
MTRISKRFAGASRTSVLLAFCLTVLGALPASAQLNFGAFTLKFTEKEMNLAHPTDMMWQKYLMWDLPFQRMNDRNMPYLELTNDANSSAPLTELRLTIGDTKFNFTDKNMGMFAMAASTTKEFDLTSSTLNNAGDELILKIGGDGLAPGEMVRFKIDLEVDAAYAGQIFMHPDYRTVMFDMNGLNVYDGFTQDFSSDDNSHAWAVFDPATGANFTTGPVALDDQIVAGVAADFYNNNYRRYRDMDPVRTFVLDSSQSVIPEPGSAALALVGVIGGLAWASRGRREAPVA